MISYWFPAPVSYWWPLAFAVAFAVIAVIAVSATLVRSPEERDAGMIATLYGMGFGIVAVSEFMMYLDLAFGWSLATAWGMSVSLVQFFAFAAAVVAAVALAAAVTLQVRDERSYRLTHSTI